MPYWMNVITLCICIATFVFAVIWNGRGDKRASTHEIEERVKENTRINTKLDDISGMTRDVKDDIASMRRDMQSYNERLIKVEESCKQAHYRLNSFEARLNQNGE